MYKKTLLIILFIFFLIGCSNSSVNTDNHLNDENELVELTTDEAFEIANNLYNSAYEAMTDLFESYPEDVRYSNDFFPGESLFEEYLEEQKAIVENFVINSFVNEFNKQNAELKICQCDASPSVTMLSLGFKLLEQSETHFITEHVEPGYDVFGEPASIVHLQFEQEDDMWKIASEETRLLDIDETVNIQLDQFNGNYIETIELNDTSYYIYERFPDHFVALDFKKGVIYDNLYDENDPTFDHLSTY